MSGTKGMPDLAGHQNKISHPLFWGYMGVLLAAGGLYAGTCAPGLVWQDSGMIQYRVWHNDIEGGLGLALSHPLFYLLAIGAKSIPLGEFPRQANLVSALAGAAAVSNLFLLLYLWQGRIAAALAGAGTLALSHTFWAHAAIPETYNLYAALLLAELIFLWLYMRSKQVGYLYGLALCNGLAVANHMLGSLSLLVYVCLGVWMLRRRVIPVRAAAVMAGCWMIGALPYEYLMVKNIVQTGDAAAVLHSAAFGTQWQEEVLNTKMNGTIVKENLMFLFYNFPTPNLVLLPIGIYTACRKNAGNAFGRISLILLLWYFVFAFRYTIVDRYAFFIPFYGLAALFIGAGCARVMGRWKKPAAVLILLLVLLPVPVYALVPGCLRAKKMAMPLRREIPYRDGYAYFLRPWQRGYRGAERFAREALASVEPNAVIYADGTTVYPLLLMQQVQGLRPDVAIVSSHGTANNLDRYDAKAIEKLLAERAVYVVSPAKGYCPAFLLEGYDFVPRGVLYRVEKSEKLI